MGIQNLWEILEENQEIIGKTKSIAICSGLSTSLATIYIQRIVFKTIDNLLATDLELLQSLENFTTSGCLLLEYHYISSFIKFYYNL